jgi:sodium-coupled neutral amino acid transporter 9
MAGRPVEFADVVRFYLGERMFYLSVVFSVLTLVGALIVYWVLMSGFLFDIVNFAHNKKGSSLGPGVNGNGTGTHFEDVWTKDTAALFLVPVMFPLLNLKVRWSIFFQSFLDGQSFF